MYVSTMVMNGAGLRQTSAAGDFYAVVPHDVMVMLFGGVSCFVLAALAIGCVRFWRASRPEADSTVRPATAWARAIRDAATLRHLHGGGVDCPSGEDTRGGWRRRFHHCTSYGFALCFAATCVAALYHSAFGWHAPYAYTSLPVLLGIAGGLGLVVGPAGLAILERQRDPALDATGRKGLDESFLALLFLTSFTGFALLVFRHRPVMGVLLIAHLGSVLALFLTHAVREIRPRALPPAGARSPSSRRRRSVACRLGKADTKPLVLPPVVLLPSASCESQP